MDRLVAQNPSSHAEHIKGDEDLKQVDAAHVELELVLEAASLYSVESLYCVIWLQVVVVHGFLCLPGPASYT